MKNRRQILSGLRCAARILCLGLALPLASLANAQNLLKNPGFESPLTTNDWIVQFSAPGIPGNDALSDVGDFAIANRSTEGSRVAGGYGAHFRTRTDWTVRAYFTQTVSGLEPGATYHLTGYAKITMADSKVHAFIEAVGGSGEPTKDGRRSVRTPDVVTGKQQTQYSLDQTADANGKVEVRLRFVKLAMKPGAVSYPKFVLYSAYFDDLSLTKGQAARTKTRLDQPPDKKGTHEKL